jgi:hypothetical protein
MRNRVDHRGREFRMAFLQTNGADDAPLLGLSVACEKPTTGTITYLNSNSTKVQVVNITVPNSPIFVTLDSNELLLPPPRSAEITRRTILIQFNDEVTLYGINTQRWSSDAFVALPYDVLGTQYTVLAYPNTIDPTVIGTPAGRSDFPSQFAIIAMEDNTVVQIDPTAALNNHPRSPFSITMNAGEVFFAQANGNAGTDVTGTKLNSTKRIIVYGSHQRANVPWNDAVGRDHLIEQLYPTDRWGTRAMLTPHFQLPKTVSDANIARIIAARNNTVISIDSVPVRTLQAGEVMETPIDVGTGAKLVTATGPILVAQYQHSTVDEKFIRQPADTVGDPFMMLVPPREYFDSAYAFISFTNGTELLFHYINVVIPTERISTLRLDGGPIGGSFSRIPKTSYSYAAIKVDPGPHFIDARVPFGLYVYGYGSYNSYGYPGGMVFDTLFKDHKEPRISIADTCPGIAGVAYDDSTFDFGMEDLRLLEGSRNVNLLRDPFSPGTPSIPFRVQLVDPYQDGWAELIAIDTAGLDSRVSFPVKGFTVALTASQTGPVTFDTLASLNGMQFCRRITLRNYGTFSQHVTGLRFDRQMAGLSITGPAFPVDIPPGESRDFSVCFQHVGDTALMVELSVDNGCQLRPLVALPLLSGNDQQPPILTRQSRECEGSQIIRISEPWALNSGVSDITYKVKKNAQPILNPAEEFLPAKDVTLTLQRIDPRQDMIYDVIITDYVGNKIEISDTVQGFTLAVETRNGDQLGIEVNRPREYQELVLGEQVCDTIYLRNYGGLPLTLHRPRILGSLQYSIPPEQFPISLAVNERRGLAICVRPNYVGELLDTFAVEFECDGLMELVELHALVAPQIAGASDLCGNRLYFEIDGFVKKSFLAVPTPNPTVNGTTTITVGLSQSQPVSLQLYDALGAEVRRMFQQTQLPRGVTRIEAQLSDLPSGLYYLRMQTASGEMMTEKLVIDK